MYSTNCTIQTVQYKLYGDLCEGVGQGLEACKMPEEGIMSIEMVTDLLLDSGIDMVNDRGSLTRTHEQERGHCQVFGKGQEIVVCSSGL